MCEEGEDLGGLGEGEKCDQNIYSERDFLKTNCKMNKRTNTGPVLGEALVCKDSRVYTEFRLPSDVCFSY